MSIALPINLDLGLKDSITNSFQQYFEDYNSLLGPSSNETMTSIMLLARIYSDQINYEAAKDLFKRGVHAMEAEFSASNPHSLFANNKYACYFSDIRNYDDLIWLFYTIFE